MSESFAGVGGKPTRGVVWETRRTHPVGKPGEIISVFHATMPVERVQRIPGLARRLRAEPGRVRAERLRNRCDKPFPHMGGWGWGLRGRGRESEANGFLPPPSGMGICFTLFT